MNIIEKSKRYIIHRLNNEFAYKDLVNFPKYFEIETVYGCNARCKMCSIDKWNRRPKVMSDAIFTKIIADIKPFANQVKRVSLYRDGEPLLDKQMGQRIARMKQIGIGDVAISTNLSLLDKPKSEEILLSGIDTVIMSIDSLNPSTYESIRVGLKFDRVMQNAIDFIELRDRHRSDAQIQMRMILMRENERELDDYLSFWKKHLRDTDRIYHYPINNWGGQLESFEPVAKSFEPNLPCIALWTLMVIHSDGIVPFCNADFETKTVSGNVMESDIEQIWTSQIINARRGNHLNGKKDAFPLCAKCNVWDEPPDKDGVSHEYAQAAELF
ncbi:MAG: radical SAM protein [Deltaproteobacteria bacterium]|nr:radical SAM protein [Deltaproteobacteria bacterium]